MILLEVARGWHINAHQPTESYLIPTEVQLTLPPGVSTDAIDYPQPDRKTFAFAQGKQLLVYEGQLAHPHRPARAGGFQRHSHPHRSQAALPGVQ